MKRKKIGMALLLSVSLLFTGMGNLPAQAVQGSPRPSFEETGSSGRTTLNFNSDWGFYQGDLEGAEATDFDDADFAAVTIPHTMRLEKKHAGDAGSVYRGIGWYRRYFTIGDQYQGKKINIDFDGVMIDSDVYLNGEKLCTRNGGYIGFSVDVTDKIHWGGQTNVLAVRVSNLDNPDTPPGKPLENLDFHYYGGIYRDVRMRITDRLYISDALQADEEAGGGVFVTYTDVSDKSASVNVKTHVVNETGRDASAVVVSRLVNQEGATVATASSDAAVPSGEGVQVSQIMTVENPKLWHPDHPDLYDLVSEIQMDGEPVDSVSTRVGIRTIDFRADGFYINGEKLYLRGANRHQSYANVGDAAPDSMQKRDAIQMKEDGFNAVRATHYPQSPAFLEACDEIGLLVIECQPGWQNFTNTQTFYDRTLRDTREMIRRDRNRPSVMLWETSLNETGYSRQWAQEATETAHREYPGDQMFTAADYGYHGDLYDVCYKVVDRSNGVETDYNPEKPFLTREWGDWGGMGQASRKNGEDALLNNVVVREKQLEGEGYPDWGGLDANARIGGYFLWSWNDYARGSQAASLVNGTVDIDRYEKYGFYWLKSMQSARNPAYGPMVFIAGANSETSDRNVTLYSNCDSVRLYQNGTLVGEQTREEAFAANSSKGENSNIQKKGGSPIFRIPLLSFAAGELRAEGILDGESAAVHTVNTPGKPARIEIEVRDRDIKPVADGSDLVPVYFKAVDENGTVIPDYDQKIRISVTGEGTLVGANIPRIDVEEQKLEAGVGHAFIRTSPTAGDVQIEAEGLSDALNGSAHFTTLPCEESFVPDGAHTAWTNGMDVFEEPYVRYDDLAYQKPVSASSTQEDQGNLPENAVDDDEATKWCASGGSYPQWLQIDLETIQAISGFQINWEHNADAYTYHIQTSFDGENWRTVVDSTEKELPNTRLDTQMADAVGRYVRLVIDSGSDGWACLYDCKVFASSKPLEELLPAIGDEAVLDLTATDASPEGRGVDTLRDGETLIGTGWLSASNTVPQSVTLSFKEPQTIVASQIYWEKDSSQYTYTLELSGDGDDWQTALRDLTVGGQSFQPVLLDQAYSNIRYVRVTITDVSAGGTPVVGMAEWTLYGMGREEEKPSTKPFDDLSDLSWESAKAGYGSPAKDRACNGSSISLHIDGETREFSKGLSGDHFTTGTEFVYDLTGKGYDSFETYVGIDTNAGKDEARTIFRVYVDGIKTYESAVLHRDGGGERIQINLPESAQTLRLTAEWDGVTENGQYNAHACWGDAKLVRSFKQIVSIAPADSLEVPVGTPFYRLPLPETVSAQLDDESTVSLPIKWTKGGYNGMTEGIYPLTGTPICPDGVLNEEALTGKTTVNVLPKSVEPEEHLLTVRFPAASAQLSIAGTSVGLANLTGQYRTNILADDEVALTFAPTAQDWEFAAATVNGEPAVLNGTTSYTYASKMPNADTNLDFAFTLVNKTILRTAMEIAETLKDGDEYQEAVPAVQRRFDAAFARALQVEAQVDAVQAEIDNAWSDLLDAIQHLSFAKGDKAPLKELLTLSELLSGDDYTSASWAAYAAVLEHAQEVYDDENAMDPELQEAVAALKTAMTGLTYKADMSALNALIEKAEEIKAVLDQDYLPTGWEAFLRALKAAKELDADAASQDEVSSAAETLTDAIAALRKIPNKDALNALLVETEHMRLGAYTASSASLFRSMRNAALAVANNPAATEAEVAQAYQNFYAAKEALQKNPPTSKGHSRSANRAGVTYGMAGIVPAAPGAAYVRSDAAQRLTLQYGQAAVFQMTVVNGNGLALNFTAGDGSVLKTQAVSRIGNVWTYKVWAVGAPGKSAGVYTQLPGETVQRHCVVTIA